MEDFFCVTLVVCVNLYNISKSIKYNFIFMDLLMDGLTHKCHKKSSTEKAVVVPGTFKANSRIIL